jgi:ssDNA-binding Zn-finger/Zn-ribbon topoisomerase 1
MLILKRKYKNRKKKPLKKCPICNEKLIKDKLNHVIMFLTCFNCNSTGLVVDWYYIPKPKRIKLEG